MVEPDLVFFPLPFWDLLNKKLIPLPPPLVNRVLHGSGMFIAVCPPLDALDPPSLLWCKDPDHQCLLASSYSHQSCFEAQIASCISTASLSSRLNYSFPLHLSSLLCWSSTLATMWPCWAHSYQPLASLSSDCRWFLIARLALPSTSVYFCKSLWSMATYQTMLQLGDTPFFAIHSIICVSNDVFPNILVHGPTWYWSFFNPSTRNHLPT